MLVLTPKQMFPIGHSLVILSFPRRGLTIFSFPRGFLESFAFTLGLLQLHKNGKFICSGWGLHGLGTEVSGKHCTPYFLSGLSERPSQTSLQPPSSMDFLVKVSMI